MKLNEKGLYITQIIIYISILLTFFITDSVRVEFMVLIPGAILSVLLNLYNIFILGNKPKKVKLTK